MAGLGKPSDHMPGQPPIDSALGLRLHRLTISRKQGLEFSEVLLAVRGMEPARRNDDGKISTIKRTTSFSHWSLPTMSFGAENLSGEDDSARVISDEPAAPKLREKTRNKPWHAIETPGTFQQAKNAARRMPRTRRRDRQGKNRGRPWVTHSEATANGEQVESSFSVQLHPGSSNGTTCISRFSWPGTPLPRS